MRKICLICIGKTKPQYIQTGINDYLKKISTFATLDFAFLKENHKGKFPIDEIKKKETLSLIELLNKRNSLRVLLDVHAPKKDSLQWSKKLQKLIERGKDLDFIIGGAYGFDSSLLNDYIDDKVSLSEMTFNHQLVRIMFLEQLYRGLCLINNIPYHK